MDIKEKLRLIHANSFYGLGVNPEDRDNIIKEVEDILKKRRRDSMSEASSNKQFVKTVEEAANVAISTGRNVNEVIHDAIEVIYGRKSINELLPSGWIVVINRCQECEYEHHPAGSSPCFRCYNRFFDDLDEGPYTDNFKPKEEKEDSTAPRHLCADCKYYNTSSDHYPCCNCFSTDERPIFTPIGSVPPQNGKEE